MIDKKSWSEFKDSGLLFYINQILHAFGWAIVFELDDNETVSDVYPARVKFRGFGENSIKNGYQKIGKYLKENSEDIYKESIEE